MKMPLTVSALVGIALVGTSTLFVEHQVSSAKERLDAPPEKLAEEAAAEKKEEVPIADHTEASYCTPEFKKVLARVVEACGLSGQDARRGCEPVDVRNFASINDEDFNALFHPLVERGGIVLFDDNSDKLDAGATALIEEKWSERKGARYFFIVARASKTGTKEANLALSQKRANSVMFQLQEKSGETDLDKKVGMLWLGSQYAQLPKDYCGTWKHSRAGKPCNDQAINRSAFISWVDCRL
jgi:outer membrane protein OmpA-like peptidoglycan-associated protein